MLLDSNLANTDAVHPVCRGAFSEPAEEYADDLELTVGDVMDVDIDFVAETAPVETVIPMLDAGAVSVPVVNRFGELTGIVTRSNVAHLDPLELVMPGGFHAVSDTTVLDVMTPFAWIARPDWPISRAIALMRAEGVRSLPVLEQGSLDVQGLITLRAALETMVPLRSKDPDPPRFPHGSVRHNGEPRSDDLATYVAEWSRSRPTEATDEQAELSDARLRADLTDRVWAFHEHVLHEHNSSQETTETFLEEFPELARSLRALRDERSSALFDLREILDVLDDDDVQAVTSLPGIRDATRTIAAVEDEEYALLHEAYLRDIPALD